MRDLIDNRLLTKHDQEAALQMVKDRLINGTWRNIYKALTLFDFILKHAPMDFVDDIKWDLTQWNAELGRLSTTYEAVDEKGKDQGINVRVKAATIMGLLKDEGLLEKARQEIKDKQDRLKCRREEFKEAFRSMEPSAKDSKLNSAPERHSDSQAADRQINNTGSDDFDDFQSAQQSKPTTAAESFVERQQPLVKHPQDPFDDLLKL